MCHIKFSVNILQLHSLKSSKDNCAHTGLMCNHCLYVTGWCPHVRMDEPGFYVTAVWSSSVEALSR